MCFDIVLYYLRRGSSNRNRNSNQQTDKIMVGTTATVTTSSTTTTTTRSRTAAGVAKIGDICNHGLRIRAEKIHMALGTFVPAITTRYSDAGVTFFVRYGTHIVRTLLIGLDIQTTNIRKHKRAMSDPNKF